jgi:hypothetical protein
LRHAPHIAPRLLAACLALALTAPVVRAAGAEAADRAEAAAARAEAAADRSEAAADRVERALERLERILSALADAPGDAAARPRPRQ